MASRRALSALRARPSFGKPIIIPNGSLQTRLSSSSSTSAIAYKALHHRITSLPVRDSVSAWSAPAAVSSILYESPIPEADPPQKHVLNCLVQNEPGVLSRVSGILAARGFNIDSLVVCNTEVEDLSRMTIVLQGQDGTIEQARRQLEDLVPVWAVLDYTKAPLVQRELLLAKVSILGPEYFEELLAHHREMTEGSAEEIDLREESKANDFHPSKLAISQALRHKHEHLEAVTHLTHQFGGKVLDISSNNCIVEVSAKPARIDNFLKLVAPFGILESARTGEDFATGFAFTKADATQVSWLCLVLQWIPRARRWRKRHRTLSIIALYHLDKGSCMICENLNACSLNLRHLHRCLFEIQEKHDEMLLTQPKNIVH